MDLPVNTTKKLSVKSYGEINNYAYKANEKIGFFVTIESNDTFDDVNILLLCLSSLTVPIHPLIQYFAAAATTNLLPFDSYRGRNTIPHARPCCKNICRSH